MKSRTLMFVTAMSLFAALAIPIQLSAQGQTRYKVIDVGTLGGPNSIPPLPLFEGTASGPESLSRAGTFTGQADTATPDPNCAGFDCFVSHAIQWRDGVLTDLGALHSSESLHSESLWISVNGLIAGFSQNGEIDPLNPDLPSEVRAVLWKHGKITDLGTLEGGTESAAFAVNARGQVVGLATNGIPDPSSILFFSTQTRAFLWQNGAMQDLGTLPGGTDALALLVNERGQIVGQSYTASSIPRPPTFTCFDFPLTLHGFFWEKGKMVDLGTLGGSCAFTYALNNRGQVVGQATLAGDQTSHPYIWDRETMMDLGTLGGTYGFASGINDAGAVIGTATNQDDEALLATLWKDGVISNLGTLPGNGCSGADAINSKGQVVGGSGFFLPDFFPGCTDPVEHAFLWENGTMVDLNAFVPPGSELTLNEAVFINNRGEISGFGTLPNGDFHAFVMIPCGGDDTEGCSDAAESAHSATGGSAAPTIKSSTTPQSRPTHSRMAAWRARMAQRLGFGRFIRTPQLPLGKTAVTSAPIATLSPTSLTFSTQAIGTTSAAKTVTLKNTGTTSLTISSIAITGTNTGNFAQTHTCGSSLAAGASCTISVTFKPTASGTRTAAVSISDNAAGSPQKVTLSGIGTTAKLSPVSLTFSTQAIGTTSGARKVTLTNVGMTSLNITGITITGTNAGDFAQTHTCGSSLSAGANCSITVTFKPTASGTRTAALSISDNAAGSPQKVTLSGIGTTAKLSPTSLSFGVVAIATIGTTSPTKTVTLTNVGTTALSITGIAITGTDAGDFFQSHDCGSLLAAGASCAISVRFRPTVIGTRRAAVSITDNAAGSPQKVTLSGIGGASGRGFCIVTSGNALNGYCIGVFNGMCRAAYDPFHCPPGQQAETPGVYLGCPHSTHKVDASRSCAP